MELRREIIREGTWHYAGTEKPVRIIRQNFDPYHWPEEGDAPEDMNLNDSGESYSVAFGELTEGWWFSSERAPVLSEAEAIELAEQLVGNVSWSPDRPAHSLEKGAV